MPSITELVSVAVSVIAILVAVVRTKPEAALNYSQAADNFSKQVIALQVRLEKAENELEQVSVQLTTLKAENEALRDWAQRLTYQLKSLNVEPVKMRAEPAEA